MTAVALDTASESPRQLAAPVRWVRVCRLEELTPGRGVAALLNRGAPAGAAQLQAAVFRTAADELYAVGNLDPFTGACVISRGLLGSREGAPTVASPMLKHVFELRTGRCVDGPAGAQPETLPIYPVRCAERIVHVGVPETAWNAR